ncbi:inhibin beta B chain-like [Patiria miniata]|uniref:TGF-beta family profile domain-containing protein n=1 Tax=Patiria miniata TaxID=46514 RepID=A0A914A0B1_PATMI|nr:inhibin beta B chain-like [Patiria miniata]
MGVPSCKLSGFLFLQLMLLSAHGAFGGVLAGRGYLTGDTVVDQPHNSSDQTNNVKSIPPSAGMMSPRRSLMGYSVGDPVDDEAHGPAPLRKPNDSPKDRTVMRSDFIEDDAIVSRPSSSPDHIQRSNSSNSASTVPLSSTPSYPSSSISSQTLEEIERLARLEMLKRTILEQLGLDRPPNVTRPKPDVPAVVLNRLLLDGEQHNHPRRLTRTHPSQIVVFADEDNADCGPDVSEESCFRFKVPDQTDDSVVFSSHIWVYVTHAPEGASVFVGRPEHHYGNKWRVLASKKLYSQEGWVELQIPVDKHKWNRPHHYFEISTKPLHAGGNSTVARDLHHRPMLLLAKVKNSRSARTGRSVGLCTTGQTSCCMKTFVADFVEIGWDSWILTPLSFNARYCSGECGVSSRHFLKDHAEMIALLMEHDQAEPDMSLCCVANEISGLAVLYFGDSDSVHQRFIDVVVENCGCL